MNREQRRATNRRAGSQEQGPTQAVFAAIEAFHRGDVLGAEALCAKVLGEAPDQPDALHLLGAIFHQRGDHGQAISLLTRSLEVWPHSAEPWNTLGTVLHAIGRAEESIPYYVRAIDLDPSFSCARLNLANALRDAGHLEQAVDAYVDAINSDPQNPEPYNNLGVVLRDAGLYEQAVGAIRHAIELDPKNPISYNNLGCVMGDLGRLSDAKTLYGMAIERDTAYAEAHTNLGNAHLSQNQSECAVADFLRAVEAAPDHAVAHKNLGHAYLAQGFFDRAINHYTKAAQLEPTWAHGLRTKLALTTPIIPASAEEIRRSRQHVEAELTALESDGVELGNPFEEVGATPFYLAFQGLNDIEMQRRIARFYARACPTLTMTAPHCLSSIAPQERPMKIGVLSAFLRNHTIGKLASGLIEHLDREKFKVVIVRTPSEYDSASAAIDACADRVVRLPSDIALAREVIAQEELDLLFYPEIGMDPMTYFLAYARLAPVQCVTWGHPETTGLPHIDAFLSSNDLETPESDDHYSEKLVRLESLPTFYRRTDVVAMPFVRSDYGLREDERLYVCPQSLFKMHPLFDQTLAEILNRDPNGRLVLVEGFDKNWDRILAERLSRIMGGDASRVKFVPRLGESEFFGLLTNADAILDPPFFGGGNTSYESFALGVPIVTLPGPFMRGRVTAACYMKMGLTDLIAKDEESYIELALRLAQDQIWHATMSRDIAGKSSVLYEQMSAVKEIGDWFEAAIRAATTPASQGVA